MSDNGRGETTPLPPQPSSSRRGSTALITDARSPASEEMSSRVRRYTFTMAFRTACFISMIFVDGPMRWVLFACALVLPYIAVIFANQANQRTGSGRISRAEAVDHPQLTTGTPEPEVIPGATSDAERNSSRGEPVGAERHADGRGV